MLPTDPAFLALTPAQCEGLYWEEVLSRRLERARADNKTVKGLEDLLVPESYEERAQEFIAAYGREKAAAAAAEAKVETETVSSFRPTAAMPGPATRAPE